MNIIKENKKLVVIAFFIVATGIVGWLPVIGQQTVFESILSTFSPANEKKELTLVQESNEASIADIWEEIEKISESNRFDSVTILGKIRLYDNLDENGIKEQQNFVLQQSGTYQRFKLETFESIQFGETLILVDHDEKEVVLQNIKQQDSLLNIYKMLSPEKIKTLFKEDGTSAQIFKEGKLKVLNIKPGYRDAVNQYHIFYDAESYEIKKIKIAYTSVPYEDYQVNFTEQPIGSENEVASAAQTNEEELEIDMNVTEYVVEYEFQSREQKNVFNFFDNSFYKVNSGGIKLKENLSEYKLLKL